MPFWRGKPDGQSSDGSGYCGRALEHSVIDGYALIVLNWSVPAQISLDPYSNIRAYMERLEARLAIRRVREAEGQISW